MWTVFLGNGLWSHATMDRDATKTLCGRSTSNAREWQRPGNEPGCERCFKKFKAA